MTTTLENEQLRILMDAAQQKCREQILAYAKAAAATKLKEIHASQWNGLAELARNPSYGTEDIKKELLHRSEKRWKNETPTPPGFIKDTETYKDELDNFLNILKSQSQQEIKEIYQQIPSTNAQKEELIQTLYLSNLRAYLLAVVEYHRATG